MTETTYLCNTCRQEHTHKFDAGYLPLRGWLMTCPKCRRYTFHRLVKLVVGGVQKRMTSWTGLTRGRV